MNNELAEFFIKFTTQGFSDVRRDIQDLQETLDDSTKNFKEATKSGDSFFGSFSGWAKKVGVLATAFVSLRNIIHGAFDAANYNVALYQAADKARISPAKMEATALGIEYLNPLKTGQGHIIAENMYNVINSHLFDLERLRTNQAVIEALGILGESLPNLKPGDQQGFIDWITGIGERKRGARQEAAWENLLDAMMFNQDDRWYFELGHKGQADLFAVGDERRVVTTREGAIEDSLDLLHSQQEYHLAWREFYQEFQPFITLFLRNIAIPLVQWLAGLVKEYGPQIENWIETALPKIQDFFIRVFKTLSALVDYFNDEGTWEDVKAAWTGKTLTQEEKEQKNIEDTATKLGAGVGAVAGLALGHPVIGGALGAGAGKLAGKGISWITSNIRANMRPMTPDEIAEMSGLDYGPAMLPPLMGSAASTGTLNLNGTVSGQMTLANVRQGPDGLTTADFNIPVTGTATPAK